MRVLVEILHPAHVHFFRNAISAWKQRGDQVLVLSRQKDVANELLDAYGIPHISISRLGPHKWQLLPEMLLRDGRMLRHATQFRPDLLVGIMGVTIAQVGKIIDRPAVVFYDTENATLTNRFTYPLAHSVCTPQCYEAPVWGRHVLYPSYHELAYLHPNRFEPDRAVVQRAGLDPTSPYFLLRFVSWQASHDVRERGLPLELKRKLVERLSSVGRVLISSEGELPKDLEKYRFAAGPAEIHHFLAHARLVVGESATVASEAAVLGVPAIYIADTSRGYVNEIERRYGLIKSYTLQDAAQSLTFIHDALGSETFAEAMRDGHARLLSERIDTTDWMLRYLDQVVQSTRRP